MTFIDSIISKLISLKDQDHKAKCKITNQEISFLCVSARKVFLSQSSLLELCAPITVCGDIHGQFYDLLRIFEIAKYPPQTNYIFLGDYVDRGTRSLETICLLFAYKIKYPNNFFLLRGNHESANMNRLYGFYDEIVKFGSDDIWKMFNDVFNCMPFAAVIDDKIFCVHGGISPSLNSVDDIKKIKRPTSIPPHGLICDLVWSDPSPNQNSDWKPNQRGTSVSFGVKPVQRFLKKNNFDLICRAHEAISDGYCFPFKGNQGIVTLFSAPHYCSEYLNKGAILNVSEDLLCTFAVMEPIKWSDYKANIEKQKSSNYIN